MRKDQAARLSSQWEMSKINVDIGTYLKTSNINRVPKYSFPKTGHKDPFEVQKEQLRPKIGPNTYKPKELSPPRSTEAFISPALYNRSTIDVRKSRKEALLGPGRYSTAFSTFKVDNPSKSLTSFGNA